MKVLYLLNAFPVATEGYVRTEVDYLVSQGVDVHVWAREHARYAFESDVPLIVSHDPRPTIRNIQPDILHMHFMTAVPSFAPAAHELGVPMTVRGHSVDHRPENIERVVNLPPVKRLFLFPHYAEAFSHAKIVPLPVAYDATRFLPNPDKEWRLVYRAAANRPGKDLDGFIRVASLLKGEGFRFVLYLNDSTTQWPEWQRDLEQLNRMTGEVVEIIYDAPQEEIISTASRAGICLRSHDPTLHPYGRPVSIAEAMGTGSVIVAKDCPGARGFMGAAGLYYQSEVEAAEMVLDVSEWPHAAKDQAIGRSFQRARDYAAHTVLPALIAEWESVLEGAHA